MDTQKSTPRDVFMHLLHVVTLYVSAGSAITLLFQYINLLFPDPLSPNHGMADAIRWALSILFVLYPVLVWTGWFLARDIRTNPWKGESKIRKWLLYLTLFLAAVLIIGDVVTLLYNFLQGDLTVPFILKILSVLIVAAAVFWHYLYELKRGPGEFSPSARRFVWGVSAAIVILIIYGFIAAGSPFRQRLVRFDAQKVNDLQMIQGQIIYYWQQKGRLPETLADLRDTISGFAAPQDPQSGDAYAYTKKNDLDFSLCARFNLESEANSRDSVAKPLGPYEAPFSWQHAAGEVCFDRHIDPELYKPLPPR